MAWRLERRHELQTWFVLEQRDETATHPAGSAGDHHVGHDLRTRTGLKAPTDTSR
jgi:hypothetical protein